MNNQTIETGLQFDNSFVEKLPDYYVNSSGAQAPSPQLLKLNESLSEELGLNTAQLSEKELAKLFTGSVAAKGSPQVALAYAGHQFGGFSPLLGDGRAILLGEVLDTKGQRKDIHLKGSGQTPFSRGGDGKAALGPVLREYILGEAMHALNVPTTRGLAVTLTGEKVVRDPIQTGAVLARVASSHIRVGTFQLFAARNEPQKVKQLADYTIQRHYPELAELENPYLGLITTVRNRQAALIAQWVLLGFVHGVMNTDNMIISGETIDYGPCAFIDDYNPDACFSSIDRRGRYALGNQPYIGQWNMARFAETLLPLLDENGDKAIEMATETVNDFAGVYHAYWLQSVCKKIGLLDVQEDDFKLATNLFEALEGQNVDFTNFFRNLAQATTGQTDSVRKMFKEPEKYDHWHHQWTQRLAQDSQNSEQRIAAMNAVNPVYIPRNHIVEDALAAAENHQNYQPFEELLEVLSKPFEKRTGLEHYTKPAPEDFGPYTTYCGT